MIEGDTLIAPFRAVPSLGLNVAKAIVAAREGNRSCRKKIWQHEAKFLKR